MFAIFSSKLSKELGVLKYPLLVIFLPSYLPCFTDVPPKSKTIIFIFFLYPLFTIIPYHLNVLLFSTKHSFSLVFASNLLNRGYHDLHRPLHTASAYLLVNSIYQLKPILNIPLLLHRQFQLHLSWLVNVL